MTNDHTSSAQGMSLIQAERQRQIDDEGYTRDHDRAHGGFALSQAAWCYRAHGWLSGLGGVPDQWPWGRESWKPRDPISNLIRAGALYLAAAEQGYPGASECARTCARMLDASISVLSSASASVGETCSSLETEPAEGDRSRDGEPEEQAFGSEDWRVVTESPLQNVSLVPPPETLADIVRYVGAWLSGSLDNDEATTYLDAHAAVVAEHLFEDMQAWTLERLGNPEVVEVDFFTFEAPSLLAIGSTIQDQWDRFRTDVWEAFNRRRGMSDNNLRNDDES